MAEEAAEALKCELKSNLDVKNVRVGGGEYFEIEGQAIPFIELILNAFTLFQENRKMEGLPTRFLGFRVVQLNLGDKRDSFLKTLIFVTRELKGWTNADTLKRANEGRNEPLNDSLSGGFLVGPVYDKGPVMLALSVIIEEIRKESPSLAGIDPIDLRNSMLSVMREATRNAGSVEHDHPDTVQNFDWASVRAKINDLIERERKKVPVP